MPPANEPTPERYARLREIVDAALDLVPSERDAFLVRRCAGDRELLEEARGLVDVSPVDDFLEPPAPTGVADLAGRRFGEFELVEEIGRGGMGVVYRAHQGGLDRDVAVKIVANPALLGSERARQRFRREARGAAQLDHPAIARVYTHGEEEGLPFLAMELVRGETLAKQIHLEGPPGDRARVRERCAWLLEVARALSAAHGAGIVHRDVKPQNILIGADGRPKLVDFGVARDESLGSISRTGELIGTPHYMSPEQLRAQNDRVDARTDVYSLGVVLFEALTGRRPYDGETVVEMLETIERRPVPAARSLNPRLPRELDWIVRQAIEVEPEHRYRSAAEFAEDLEAFLDDGTPRHAGPRPWGRAIVGLFRRRRGGFVAVGFVALIAAVAVLLARPAPVPSVALSVRSEISADVTAVPIDPRTGLVVAGDALELGRTPVTGAALPLGSWSVRLHDGDRLVGESHVHAADPTRAMELPEFRAPRGTGGMIRIPAGPSTLRDGTVELPAYWIDETEVSNAQYLAFVQATGHRVPEIWPEDWQTGGLSEEWLVRPVVDVDLSDARAFAAWSGKRLPTYAEWVRAASGDEGWAYPWGDTWAESDEVRERANVMLERYERPAYDARGRTNTRDLSIVRTAYLREVLPVRQPEEHLSPFGLSRTIGNVCEWTSSRVLDRSNDAVLGGSVIVVGADWHGHPRVLTSEIVAPEGVQSEAIGFRCATSASRGGQ